MEAVLQSFLLVAFSEMGDKTQLLALVLALRFKKPWPIMAGIFVATILNHGLASAVGGYLAGLMSPEHLRYLLAALFLGFAIWILFPDKEDDGPDTSRFGAFLTTLVVFFLAEMGDKTQLATVALGAKFQAPVAVTVGTTMGMLFADGLAVAFGEKLTQRVSMKHIRFGASALFVLFALWILWAS
jgi:putative Ca2+/H+ antiporter (TMEM165/GDT1 family)